MFDIANRHPLYEDFHPSWEMLRDAYGGEDDIKAGGERYLPNKSGIEKIAETDGARAQKAYDAYRRRAEFPDLVALTIRGAVGTMLDKPAEIELPSQLEPLRERATRDGLTLEALHRRVATEVLLTGRYGLLPGISQAGVPYLAGYTAESIINWDVDEDQNLVFLVLDESGPVRNPETNAWETVDQYRECVLDQGRYVGRVWRKDGKGQWTAEEPVEARDRQKRPLPFIPFTFVNTSDLTPSPDDVPLYGLAKTAVRIYQLDADYRTTIHFTAEPTPVVSGFDDPADAAKTGKLPQGIGASTLWVLPEGGDAKFLEFSGPGASEQREAIQRCYDRAVMFGAQLLSEQGGQESGEAKKVRLDAQHATLKGIAMTTAAGLERALRNVAVWIGANPDQVKVAPNLDFFSHTLSAQEIDAIIRGWQAGAFSWRTAFDRLKKGNLIPDDRTPEEELEMIDQDEAEREGEMAAMLPIGQQKPAT